MCIVKWAVDKAEKRNLSLAPRVFLDEGEKVMAKRFNIFLMPRPLMLRLIGREAVDTPTYEFGILRGSIFGKKNILKIKIYTTNIQGYDAEHKLPLRNFVRYFGWNWAFYVS
jgi:hypothetical protein